MCLWVDVLCLDCLVITSHIAISTVTLLLSELHTSLSIFISMCILVFVGQLSWTLKLHVCLWLGTKRQQNHTLCCPCVFFKISFNRQKDQPQVDSEKLLIDHQAMRLLGIDPVDWRTDKQFLLYKTTLSNTYVMEMWSCYLTTCWQLKLMHTAIV